MFGINKMTPELNILLGSMIGYLANNFGTIISFYFGSSKGSQDKDTLLAAKSNTDTPAPINPVSNEPVPAGQIAQV